MKTYKTKVEAYSAGVNDGYFMGLERGKQIGIAQERARAKKKLDPYYNRPVDLKERVDREAEMEYTVQSDGESWKWLGKTKQPSLWQRLTRPIIRELKGFFRP